MIARIEYGAAHEYEVVPTLLNRVRWALLRRIKPFSRRLWWGNNVIGWPTTRVKVWRPTNAG